MENFSENAVEVFHMNQLDGQKGSSLWRPLIFLLGTGAYPFLKFLISYFFVFQNSQILTQKIWKIYIWNVCIDSIFVEGHPHTDWIIADRKSHRLSSVPAMHGFFAKLSSVRQIWEFCAVFNWWNTTMFFIQEFIGPIFPDSCTISHFWVMASHFLPFLG